MSLCSWLIRGDNVLSYFLISLQPSVALWPVLKNKLPPPLGFPDGSNGKESACNAGNLGSIPGSGRSPGEGTGDPLQFSCLENFMDREPGRLQSIGSQRVGHNWSDWAHTSIHHACYFNHLLRQENIFNWNWTRVSYIGGRFFIIWATRVMIT